MAPHETSRPDRPAFNDPLIVILDRTNLCPVLQAVPNLTNHQNKIDNRRSLTRVRYVSVTSENCFITPFSIEVNSLNKQRHGDEEWSPWLWKANPSLVEHVLCCSESIYRCIQLDDMRQPADHTLNDLSHDSLNKTFLAPLKFGGSYLQAEKFLVGFSLHLVMQVWPAQSGCSGLMCTLVTSERAPVHDSWTIN